MASILKIDELQGNTAVGDITITSEGGSATMQLQQGVVKAWAHVNGTGTPATQDSFNISSLSDEGTGGMLMTCTNGFSALTSMVTSGGASNGTARTQGYSTSVFLSATNKYWISASWGTTIYDVQYMMGQVTGDLA